MNTDSSGHRDIFQINFTNTTHEAQDHNRKKPSAPPKAFLVAVGLSPPLMADNQGPGSAPRGGDLSLWVWPHCPCSGDVDTRSAYTTENWPLHCDLSLSLS